MNTVGLAERLAEIARKTIDPDAARSLMDIVHELMTEAGLSEVENEGGGEPPPGEWRNAAPADCPEYA